MQQEYVPSKARGYSTQYSAVEFGSNARQVNGNVYEWRRDVGDARKFEISFDGRHDRINSWKASQPYDRYNSDWADDSGDDRETLPPPSIPKRPSTTGQEDPPVTLPASPRPHEQHQSAHDLEASRAAQHPPPNLPTDNASHSVPITVDIQKPPWWLRLITFSRPAKATRGRNDDHDVQLSNLENHERQSRVSFDTASSPSSAANIASAHSSLTTAPTPLSILSKSIRPCYVLILLGILTVVGSLAPAIWRSTKGRDLPGAFSLAQYILGVGVFVVGSATVIHSKTCTCWQ